MHVGILSRTENEGLDGLEASHFNLSVAHAEIDAAEVFEAAVDVQLLVLGVGVGGLRPFEVSEEATAPERAAVALNGVASRPA